MLGIDQHQSLELTTYQFYGLLPLDAKRATDGTDPRVPEAVRSDPNLHEAAKVERARQSNEELPLVMRVRTLL